MIKVLFVCHGNICRSPMAEFLFKNYVKTQGSEKNFYIASKGTSSEELGNGVHYGTKKILDKLGIDCSAKKAEKVIKSDGETYDFIICMDQYNVINLRRIIPNNPNKIFLLLSFAKLNRDIADPWYTGDFEQTYKDIMLGIKSFYEYLINEKKI